MAVTYVCPTCAAKMSVDEAVENLRCPACRIAMLPQDQAGGSAPAGRVTPPAPVAPPFKGLKVARAVRAFGDAGVAPAVPVAGRTAPSAETQSVAVPTAPGGSLAQEMEKMVLTARRQAEKEAELVLETARLRAQQEGETYRRQLEEALQAEVVNLRAAQQQQAAEAAAALVQQARQDAQREAEAVLAAARQQGEEVVAEARKAVIGEVQKLAKEARARADEIRAKAQDEVSALRTKAVADAESTKAEAAKLLDEIACPNVRIQYDLYHAQREEGELIATVRQHLARIGHIQIADNPGRHQPGTGEINFPFVFRQLDEMGYQGYVGLEYIPAPNTAASFGWLRDHGFPA